MYAPIAGVVTSVAATKHALTITADNGRSVLVHVGIDTVKLGGKPFTLHVEQGERVERDQLIMEADVDAIKQEGLSPLIIVALLAE